MKNNPFKKDSIQYHDFNILSDLKWHCTKCELKAGQAKTWQVWRQEKGIQFDVDEKGRGDARIFCKKCNKTTVHRKFKSTEILNNTKTRAGMPASLAKRVKNLYKNIEAVFLRELSQNQLEVDHKFPQVRWSSDEDVNDPKMSEENIRDKFILLSRSNNLLKSRYCERCYKTGKRGFFPGIYYWYKGSDIWDKKIDKHEREGCKGCFWNDPHKWRDALNKEVNK